MLGGGDNSGLAV